jgi:hypothetical protein
MSKSTQFVVTKCYKDNYGKGSIIGFVILGLHVLIFGLRDWRVALWDLAELKLACSEHNKSMGYSRAGLRSEYTDSYNRLILLMLSESN